MTQASHKIVSLSESSIVVEFGNVISVRSNDKALDLAAAIDADPFPGFIEAVPAYASTTIFYDPLKLGRSSRSIDDVISAYIELAAHSRRAGSIVEIAVEFNDECSLDLDEVCTRTSLSRDEYISRFLSRTYRVFMIGFLPGFPYMGEVDESIAVPRRKTPRTAVPKGSVGIAGRQTGIYPLDSPGGWQVIGRTSLDLFTPDGATPTLLDPGDEVRFTRAA